MQANEVDVGFILNDWNKILEGDEKENIFVADYFRSLLGQAVGWIERWEEIDAAFNKMQEERKSQKKEKRGDVVYPKY